MCYKMDRYLRKQQAIVILVLTFITVLFVTSKYYHIGTLESVSARGQEVEEMQYRIHQSSDTNYARFDVGKTKLNFLPNFKNPCILERLNANNNKWIYSDNKFVSDHGYSKRERIGDRMVSELSDKPYGVTVNAEKDYCGIKGGCRLRCLPYFMLIGVAKCGTGDFFFRSKSHPHIFPALNKEVFYWSQFRFQINATVGDYMDLFDNSLPDLLKIREYRSGKEYYPAVVSEYTSTEFTDNVFWMESPQNDGQDHPKHTVAHDLYSVSPNTKLIVILRDPTTRLYSSYNMFNGQSPEDFHARVVSSMEWWRNCIELLGLPREKCAYGSPPEMPPVVCVLLNVTENNRWPGDFGNYSGEIRRGMYAIFAKNWLSVFPREQILFLRTEDNSDMLKTFNEIVLPFLDLPAIQDDEKAAKQIGSDKIRHTQEYLPMLTETKEILDDFYAPFNQELAQQLGDDKWLWNDS